MPLISVIIPAYNQARYLSETVQSVLQQEFADWECIIVDDGATDETPEIADGFAKQDPRIRVIHQPNAGLSAARNTGLTHALGLFSIFLDSDDILLPAMMAHCLGVLASHPEAAAIVCDSAFIDAESMPLGSVRNSRIDSAFRTPVWAALARFPLPVFLQGNLFPCMAGLWRSDLLRKAGGFNESLTSLEDFDLWIRVMEAGGQIYRTDVVLCAYRRMNGSMSTNRRRMYNNGRKVLDDYFMRTKSVADGVQRAAYFSQAAPFYPDVVEQLPESPASLRQLFTEFEDDSCGMAVRLRMIHTLSVTAVPPEYLDVLGASPEIRISHRLAEIRRLLKSKKFIKVIVRSGLLIANYPVGGILALFEFIISRSMLTLGQSSRALGDLTKQLRSTADEAVRLL